jgi:hypothetical protein
MTKGINMEIKGDREEEVCRGSVLMLRRPRNLKEQQQKI